MTDFLTVVFMIPAPARLLIVRNYNPTKFLFVQVAPGEPQNVCLKFRSAETSQGGAVTPTKDLFESARRAPCPPGARPYP